MAPHGLWTATRPDAKKGGLKNVGSGLQGDFDHGAFPCFQIGMSFGRQPFDEAGGLEFFLNFVFGVFFTVAS